VYTAVYRAVYTFPDGTLRPCAARYGTWSVYAAVYTARVDEHVYGCVWDVYTTVYMARYGRVHGPRPERAVSARVHGRVGLPAMYTTVYWPCTRTCTVHGAYTAF